MANLYATLGQNNQKVTHDTFNYGTPRIYPIVVVRTDEGDWTGYASSGSDFFKVVNYLQGRGVEVYGIGDVSGTAFSIFVNWEKMPKDAGEEDPNDTAELNLLMTEIQDKLSIGVRIDYGKIIGEALSNNC
jgi:hypothetical protein